MLRTALSGFVLTCLLSLPPQEAEAQLPVSILAGPTISNVSTDEYDTESTVGIFVALATAIPLSERLMLMPNLGYVQKGAEFAGTEGSYDYIEIPVLLGTRIPLNETLQLGVHAGPQVAFNVSCDEDGFDCSDFEDFNSTEFGLVFGANVSFPLSENRNLALGAAYDLALTDLFDSEDSYKNRVLYLYAGFTTLLGGGAG